MIIARSPLRISLGGGGTDLPSYYQKYGGILTAASIDKYVYVTIMKTFVEGIVLRYSSMERVNSISEIKHPIVREALNLLNNDFSKTEITSFADIPAGTGLGSSGSFTTALLKALFVHKRQNISNEKIAELACQIEIDILKEPIGKQDQYAAAIGGINTYTFHENDTVTAENLNISHDSLHDLEDNLLLFFTGFSRRAGKILVEQKSKSDEQNIEMLNNLNYVKDLGIRSRDCLLNGDILMLGKLMNEHWEYKRRRSGEMSNALIDKWYDMGLKNGAIGGKLVGAGGGGFLLFVAKDRVKLREAMSGAGLTEVRFNFDFEGTKIMWSQ